MLSNMNCLYCNKENENGAKFCKHCGIDMNYKPETEDKNKKLSDILLFVFIVTAFICQVARYIIIKCFDFSSVEYLWTGLNIIGIFSYVLIPLSIKDKTLKIVGIVIISIFIIMKLCFYFFLSYFVYIVVLMLV